MNDLLNTVDYIKIKDPTNKYQSEIKKTIKNNNLDYYKINIMNPRTPLLYGQPKLHKTDSPMRPVVSYVNAPNYKLCKYMNNILPDKINFKSDKAIKNTIELITKLNKMQISPTDKLISFDVKSLFTSIPINELNDILKDHINNSNIESSEKPKYLEMLNTCIQQNYFKFNQEIYKQINGLPMGNPLSPLLAEIYMAHFEKIIFNSNNKHIKQITFWARYVDDIFCIFKGTERQANGLLKHINSLNDKIQFTIEFENNNQLNFLDITIKKDNNKLAYNIYRKPTYTDTIIHAKSKQSWTIKMSPFHSYIHRLLNIPMNPIDYNKEVQIIKTIAQNNGYNPKIIEDIIKHKQKKILQKNFYPIVNESENKKWHTLNYIPTISKQITKILNKFDVKIINVNTNNVGTMLINGKDKIPTLEKSGVYQINCKDCQAIYVGQSGRNIKTRLNEHKRAILQNLPNTGFTEHCINNNHFPDMDSYKLLYNINKSKKLNYLEILEIKKAINRNANVTNTQTEYLNTPFIDLILKPPLVNQLTNT
jgi:hypothetical protein